MYYSQLKIPRCVFPIVVLFLLLTGCMGEPEKNEPFPADSHQPGDLESGDSGLVEGSAKALYNFQCEGCHGVDGRGGPLGGELLQCGTCGNYDLLFNEILRRMPVGGPGKCDAECAEKLTHYILNNFVEVERDPALPIADISLSRNLSGYAPLTVQFDARASSDNAGITSYTWNFGDNSDSNLSAVDHTYSQAGTYNTSLTVSDGDGNSDTFSFVVSVFSLEELRAYPDAASIYQTQCVECHGENGEGDGEAPAFDLAYPIGQMVDIIRLMPPEVGLSCPTAVDCAPPLAQYILDTFVRVNAAPVANASASSNLSGTAPLRINLNASLSTDDHGIEHYRWYFPGGEQRSGQMLSYIFSEDFVGTQQVILQVIDEEGLSDFTTLEVVVIPPQGGENQAPLADLRAEVNGESYFDALTSYQNIQILFDGSASQDDDGITAYQWNFGDGSTASGSQTNHHYANLGSYSVTLTVSDAEGATNSTSMTVQIVHDANSNPDQYYSCDLSQNSPINPLRRLSVKQYHNTLQDLIRSRGFTEESQFLQVVNNGINELSPDQHESGFNHIDQRVNLQLVEAQMEIADSLSRAISENSSAMTNLVGSSCSSNFSSATCRNTLLDDFGSRVLRRPIVEADRIYFSTAESWQELLAMLLLAPDFLLHNESRGTDISVGLKQLTQFELAARLSYLFWGSMPDDTLYALAQNGSLQSDYESVVTYVFEHSKTRAHLLEFFEQWLKLEHIPEDLVQNQSVFPDFLGFDYGFGTTLPETTNLVDYRQSAIDEVLALADYVVWEREAGVDALFTESHSFARSEALASAYGLNGATWNGNYANLIEFPQNQTRSGLLTRAALQMYGGAGSRPILKGVRIRRDILCDVLEPPPADNSAPDEAILEEDFNSREETQAITEIPGTTCAGCHAASINPLGFPSEHFDTLGRYRNSELIFDDEYSNILYEVDIDTVSTPRITASDTTAVNDAIQLSEQLAIAGKTKACIARKYHQYTWAHSFDAHFFSEVSAYNQVNGCALHDLFEAVRDEGVIGMLKAIALQEKFKQRRFSH